MDLRTEKTSDNLYRARLVDMTTLEERCLRYGNDSEILSKKLAGPYPTQEEAVKAGTKVMKRVATMARTHGAVSTRKSNFNVRRLRGGKKRIVHVIAKTLAKNMDTGLHQPLIGVRSARNPDQVRVYRHAEILGPSKLMHTPNAPLPGTDGRGICYLVTRAPIRVYLDRE